MIRMIATTMSSSISEKPFCFDIQLLLDSVAIRELVRGARAAVSGGASGGSAPAVLDDLKGCRFTSTVAIVTPPRGRIPTGCLPHRIRYLGRARLRRPIAGQLRCHKPSQFDKKGHWSDYPKVNTGTRLATARFLPQREGDLDVESRSPILAHTLPRVLCQTVGSGRSGRHRIR